MASRISSACAPSGSDMPLAARLEELDGVTRRILEQDLAAAAAGHDLAAKAGAGSAQPLDLGVEVVDLDLEAVPAARLGHPPVRRRLGCATLAAGAVEQQAQVAAAEHCERRRGAHLHLEAEPVRVERNCRVDVVDDVADA